MPTNTFVNGTTTRRPGVYADVDVSALGGSSLTTNIMAIVGDFPELETAVPAAFNTANQLKLASPRYDNQLIAKVVYNPANDDRVAGSPSAVWLVNGGTSTQAQVELFSTPGGAVSSLLLKSKKWGPLGNTGTVSVELPAGGATNDRTVTMTVNGVTETLNFEGQDLVTFGYAGTDATAMTADVRSSGNRTKLIIEQTATGIPAGAYALATGSWKFDGTLAFTASGAGNHSLAISGIRKDTGATFSSTLTFTASATPDAPLGFEVAAITSLTWTPAAAETLEVVGNAFDLDLTSSEYRYIKDVFDHIDQFSDQGWNVTTVSPLVGSIESIYLDGVAAGQDVFTPATLTVTADLWRLYSALLPSALVEPELGTETTDGFGQIDTFVGAINFAGGTFTAGDAASVGNAYTALRTVDAQIVVNFYSDLATAQALRSHCEYMAGQGLGERNGWTATATNTNKADCFTRTAQLNTRHVSTCHQEVQLTDHTGATVWEEPLYQALTCAAMQASTPVGTPLTSKVANVLDVRSDSTWDADQDANELLGRGMTFFTTSKLGFKVERSITTYQTDDNPVFSELSANESLYTSIRDLRQNLRTLIGDPALATTATQVKALSKARLRFQVENEIIKAFNERSLNVEDLGDTFRVNVELAVVEPLNFILVSAKVTRIPFNA